VTTYSETSDFEHWLPAFVGVFLVGGLYKPTLPLYFEAVGIPLALLGIVRSVADAVGVGAPPVAGVLADRMGLAAVAASVVFPAACTPSTRTRRFSPEAARCSSRRASRRPSRGEGYRGTDEVGVRHVFDSSVASLVRWTLPHSGER